MKIMSGDGLIKKLPQYYVVDDVPVHLELEGNEVVGYNWLENAYPVRKAMAEGERIDRDEYLRLVKEMKK